MASILLQKPSSRRRPSSLLALYSSFLCLISSTAALPQQVPPTSTSSPPSAATSGSPGYASTSSNNSNGISNYYFIIIAVGVVALLIVFWLVVRKRTAAVASTMPSDTEAGTTTQRASSRRWQMPMPALARWIPIRQERPEEGLDERGEAPPPYMPGQTPPPAHFEGQVHHPVTGEPIPLEAFSGKPPDYEDQSASSSEVDLTRPPQAHVHADRHTTERPVMETAEASAQRDQNEESTAAHAETSTGDNAKQSTEASRMGNAEQSSTTRAGSPEPTFVASIQQSLKRSGLGRPKEASPARNQEESSSGAANVPTTPENQEPHGQS